MTLKGDYFPFTPVAHSQKLKQASAFENELMKNKKQNGDGLMKREKTIRFRVNDDELKAIEARAFGSVSAWLRDLALNEPKRRKPKPVDPQLLFELNKIGVNLNQIARYCNTAPEFSGADKVDLLLILAGIEEELKALRADYAS